MKNIIPIIKIVCLLHLVCNINTSCSSKDIEYPINVSFKEYSLSETFCEWIPLSLSCPHFREVVIINSNEQLSNYIIFHGEKRPPVIDFSKFSLLIARGVEVNNDLPEQIYFQKKQLHQYTLTIYMNPGLSPMYTNWQAAIIVDKLGNDDNIELVVTMKNS